MVAFRVSEKKSVANIDLGSITGQDKNHECIRL